MNDWIFIACMTALTFFPRYIPFALAGKVEIPSWISRALAYVPIAVLSSIVVQTSVIREGNPLISLDNLHLLAAIASFVTAVISRHLFLTITIGLIVFGLLRFLSV